MNPDHIAIVCAAIAVVAGIWGFWFDKSSQRQDDDRDTGKKTSGQTQNSADKDREEI